MKAIDLKGQTFGQLFVLGRLPNDMIKGALWLCKCSCGLKIAKRSQHLRAGSTKSCGHIREKLLLRRGNEHPKWKGGKYRKDDGYVRYSAGPNLHKTEHRVIMEGYLGRSLLPGETVHHKNGIRHDNRIENLELKASAHGGGQNTDDLIKWAKEILNRYCPEALR